jgi:hypothetical protein
LLAMYLTCILCVKTSTISYRSPIFPIYPCYIHRHLTTWPVFLRLCGCRGWCGGKVNGLTAKVPCCLDRNTAYI